MEKQGRTILVTGGGSGIGRAAALRCAERGDRIAILDIDGKSAEDAAAKAQAQGATAAIGIRCDVTAEGEVARAFEQSAARLGPVYGVFANAGMDAGGVLHELPFETWKRVLDTNLTGVYLTCKFALRQLLAAGTAGSIVCTSSPGAFVAFAAGGAGAYSASKGGISALVRCMALDYARYGIRVNAVVPGATETRLMWANVAPEDLPKMRQQVCTEVPIGPGCSLTRLPM
jgi:NAD(P)-dependent dehydrogenase (short-subunit alcohol dehydrogenase family)